MASHWPRERDKFLGLGFKALQDPASARLYSTVSYPADQGGPHCPATQLPNHFSHGAPPSLPSHHLLFSPYQPSPWLLDLCTQPLRSI